MNPNHSTPTSTSKKNNYCYLIGNLGMDPVERAKGKTPVVGFSIAENVQKFDEATRKYITLHTNWFQVTVFGETAEEAKKLFKKGDRIVIEGRMKVYKYTTKNGEERTGFEILAEKLSPWRRDVESYFDPEALPF